MNKIIVIALVAFFFLSKGTVYADQSVNLIQNPSLETASQTSSDTPDFWHWDYFGNNNPTFTYPVPGYLGGSAAKVDMTARTSGDAKWFFESVSVTPGQQYSFSDYYMSTVNTRVIVQYTMSDGSFQYQNIGVAKPSPNSWQQFTATFIVPAGVVKVSVFHRLMRVGSLTVDNYSLTDPVSLPTPPPPSPPPPVPPPVVTSSNLIINPSAENQTGGSPDNWYTDFWGTNRASFEYPVAGMTGNAVQTTITSYTNGDAKWLWEPVAVQENADYTFSEYYKSDTKSIVIVDFNMADGTRQFTNLIALPPAATWTKVQKEFNVRPGTASVTVLHVLRSVGTLAIDDVSLSKLPDGTFSEGLVSLSFDDGGSSFYTDTLPQLLSHNFLASSNIVNDFVNQTNYMNTNQIAEINKDGMEIGSHSFSHPYLTSLSDSDLQHEILDSKNELLSLGFTPVSIFAYPYGDYNDKVENAVISNGYKGARITDQGFNTRNSDVYALRTENVESDTTLAQIKTWIDDAIKNKTWLILGLHDVGNQFDTYTITPAMYQGIIDYLVQTKVRVVTTDYVVSNLMH